MENGKLLKIALVLIMTIALLVMATNVFAATLDGGYTVDLTNTLNGINSSNTQQNTQGNVNEPSYNTALPTANNVNTNLPSTGVAENTMLVVALVVLAITAIYAYRKIKYYKSI